MRRSWVRIPSRPPLKRGARACIVATASFREGEDSVYLVATANRCARNLGRHWLVLVQPEMEKRRFPLVSIPPFGGIFKAWGLSIRWRLGGARTSSHAPVHRLDEPTGISLGMVASPQARFRFARQNRCNSATSCRCSTPGLPVTPPESRSARPESLVVIAWFRQLSTLFGVCQ